MVADDHQKDLDRFGIDPADPFASDRAGLAHDLLELGVPMDDIRAAGTFGEISTLTWTHVFGVAGTRLPAAEAARRVGMTEASVARVFRALGFSDADVAGGLREADLNSLQLMSDAVAVLGTEQVVHLARVIGSSMARIGETAAASMRVQYETPVRTNTSYPDWVRLAAPMIADFLDRLAKVMDTTLRHHLTLISARAATVDPEGAATTMPVAVGFADMVGFTGRSGSASTKQLARAIDDFEGRVSDTVTRAGGRVVKFIGDEVMFAFDDPASACSCALDLLALVADDAIPDVRVGLAFGEVVNRYGDYYGPVVNLAARLVDVALAGAVLVTPDVAERAADGFGFEALPRRELKGITDLVEPLLLRSSS